MTITEHPLIPDSPDRRKQRSLYDTARLLVFGAPIASEHEEHALVSKLIALPTFCSDAISSVAYGGQQILLALCTAGLWMPQYRETYGNYVMDISWAILLLLIIVTASYTQTLYAYPGGGGSYIVSRTNLGTTAGLVAAAALLIDYVLTAAVSVASGLQNLQDVPMLADMHIGKHMVLYCLAALWIIVLANLRGLKESGKLFAAPHYSFIVMCYVMVAIGILGPFIGWQFHPEYVNQVVPHVKGAEGAFGLLGMAVLLRAFANGCSAMTGIEAVSNGIPAFKEPKSRNATIVLLCVGVILGTIFLGVSWLTVQFHVVYWEHAGVTAPAVIDQVSGMVFGKTGTWSWAYLFTQLATALILIIAAQTSFAGFPRLASILARDGYLPRQLTNLGDKLAFNNGIMVLGVLSSFFLILEHGSVDLLIPFFAIGVFMAFTMSQAGMVQHWRKLRGPGWMKKATINGIGSLASFVVVIDIAAEKFTEGAWLIFIILFGLLWLFKSVSQHYAQIARQLSPANFSGAACPVKNTVIVLVEAVHVGTLDALEYARTISQDCTAVYVAIDPEKATLMRQNWEKFVPDIPLVILMSPYRSLLVPIMRYLDDVHERRPNHRITVIIGEFVPTGWWQNFLHGNTGLLLKLALLGRHDIVVANVRYWLSDNPGDVPPTVVSKEAPDHSS